MRSHWNKVIRSAGAPLLAVALTGCSVGSLVGAPTPEPWSPPPTPTVVVAPIATPAPAAEQQRRTVAVQLGSLPDKLELAGQVAPALERELGFRQDGILRTLYIEPGALVTAGQLLAELDLGTLQDQLRQARIVAEQDARALAQAGEQATLAVRTAELTLESAQGQLSKLKTPPTPLAIAEARAQLQQAEAELARIRNDASAEKSRAERALADAVKRLETIQATYGDIKARNERRSTDELRQRLTELEPLLREAESAVALAQIELDTARGNEIAAVKAAEAAVALARANLDQLVAGPTSFEVAEAERAVRLAQVQLAAARQATAANPSLAKVLATSELAVKEIENQIESRRIYAPFDGTITGVDALAGFPVQAELPIVRIMDGSGLQVTVSGISEADLTRLPPDTQVAIRFSRYPETAVAGVVREAATGYSAATPTLHVAYTASGLTLPIGEPAQVLADFGMREGALLLPVEALRREGGPHVMLLEGEEERRVDVAIGVTVGGQVEILAGLNEGDVVVLP